MGSKTPELPNTAEHKSLGDQHSPIEANLDEAMVGNINITSHDTGQLPLDDESSPKVAIIMAALCVGKDRSIEGIRC
jgi:hypothetical protein